MKPTFLILAVSLAACTSPTAPGGATASMANTCINPARIQKQEIVSDSVIKFTLSNGEVWTNTMDSPCAGLRSERNFSWEVHGMTVCSHQQTIHVNEIGTSCQLGDFVRVSGPTTSSAG